MTPLAILNNPLEWWSSLDLVTQVFLAMGCIAGLITVILLLMTILGLDHGEIVDAIDGDPGMGDGFFSLRSITAFFLGLGWGGYLTYLYSGNVLAAGIVGFILGVILMYSIYVIGKSLMKLQSDGTVNYDHAIGHTGTVYITIPPNREQGGQAQVSFNKRFAVLNVISESEKSIPSGTHIKVKERIGKNLFLVEPL